MANNNESLIANTGNDLNEKSLDENIEALLECLNSVRGRSSTGSISLWKSALNLGQPAASSRPGDHLQSNVVGEGWQGDGYRMSGPGYDEGAHDIGACRGAIEINLPGRG